MFAARIRPRDRTRRARAFTLIEILVGCVLLLLILALIMQVVVPMGRGAVRGSQQIEIQQLTLMAMSKICADLSTAPSAGLARYPATGAPPPGRTLIFSIQAFTGVDTVGQQTWSDQLIIYWWRSDSGKLYRLVWPPGYPVGRRPDIDEAFKPTLDELTLITDNPRGQERVLGIFKTVDLDLSRTPHTVSLSAEAPAPEGSPPESFSLSRKIYLRNDRY
ncbi:hypothetical protein DYH09_18950 [bacterium CPR1]|nr:hypothetical protein [bacterium CPR1]